jgi:hypothetical protein
MYIIYDSSITTSMYNHPILSLTRLSSQNPNNSSASMIHSKLKHFNLPCAVGSNGAAPACVSSITRRGTKGAAVLCKLMVHSSDSYVDDGHRCGDGGNNLSLATM